MYTRRPLFNLAINLMKKTLVALAALATTGAFAQVTITGELVMGYSAYTKGGATTADNSGFGVDTSRVYFNASEDLGGGTKLDALMSIGGLDRSGESDPTNPGVTAGKNAFLKLTTDVGVLTLASAKPGDLSSGIAAVGASYYQFDKLDIIPNSDGLFYKRPNRDSIAFAVPVGPVTLSMTELEAGADGLGIGAAGSSKQRTVAYQAGYKSGPIAANLYYGSFDNRDTTEATVKDQTRLEGAYDFGMVKAGLGFQVTNSDGAKGAKDTQTLLGLSAPLGNLKLGVNWGNRKTEDYATVANNGTRSGYILGANYALSKRTSIIGNYARWDAASTGQTIGKTSAVGLANPSSSFALLLSHTF